jgi:hypothetical protein
LAAEKHEGEKKKIKRKKKNNLNKIFSTLKFLNKIIKKKKKKKEINLRFSAKPDGHVDVINIGIGGGGEEVDYLGELRRTKP